MKKVPPSGPITSPIMIVGEAPGADEERLGAPFVGASGLALDRMLSEVGIARPYCFVTNVCRYRPPGNQIESWIAKSQREISPEHLPMRDRMVMPPVAEGFQELQQEIITVQPKLIIALGNVALWALTGKWGITKWRGSQLVGEPPIQTPIPVIPTYHPAGILRNWGWRPIAVQDFRRAKSLLASPSTKPHWKLVLSPSFIQAMDVLEFLRLRLDEGPPWIDLDLETEANHIACCGLSWSYRDAISIPFTAKGRPEGYWSEREEIEVVSALRDVLTHPSARIRWQNGLFDAQFILRYWRFVPNAVQDTMISQHTLYPSMPKALDFQASMYCAHYVYWKDDGKRIDPNAPDINNWSYNCEDCLRTREVGEVELRTVDKVGKQEPHRAQQEIFWPVLAAMHKGVRFDEEERSKLKKFLREEIRERGRSFQAMLGHSLNPSSNPQMVNLFYSDLAQQVVYKVRMKQGKRVYTPTTDDAALEVIGAREPLLRQLCDSIREWRSLRVYLNTFASMECDIDGRVRCSYNICGTKTYRFSSSENVFGSGTNLQNMPMGDDTGLPNMRRVFIPDEGYTFFDLDLSKADLRVVAWEAQEEAMMELLQRGRDPYVEAAKAYYKDPFITKTLPNGEVHPRYKIFKSFAHGTHYLGSPTGIAKNLGLKVHEVEKTQQWYFSQYPNIKRWQERIREEFLASGKVRNAFGYDYKCVERLDDASLREAIAWIPQSTVALYINQIWLKLYEAFDPTELQILLQVHDSLAGQFLTERKEAILAKVKEIASSITIPYPTPLHIPIGLKTSEKSWGDCG